MPKEDEEFELVLGHGPVHPAVGQLPLGGLLAVSLAEVVLHVLEAALLPLAVAPDARHAEAGLDLGREVGVREGRPVYRYGPPVFRVWKPRQVSNASERPDSA